LKCAGKRVQGVGGGRETTTQAHPLCSPLRCFCFCAAWEFLLYSLRLLLVCDPFRGNPGPFHVYLILESGVGFSLWRCIRLVSIFFAGRMGCPQNRKPSTRRQGTFGVYGDGKSISSLTTPLSVQGRDILSSRRQPPQTHRFAALWRPIFTPTGVFVSFNFLTTDLLAAIFLLGFLGRANGYISAFFHFE